MEYSRKSAFCANWHRACGWFGNPLSGIDPYSCPGCDLGISRSPSCAHPAYESENALGFGCESLFSNCCALDYRCINCYRPSSNSAVAGSFPYRPKVSGWSSSTLIQYQPANICGRSMDIRLFAVWSGAIRRTTPGFGTASLGPTELISCVARNWGNRIAGETDLRLSGGLFFNRWLQSYPYSCQKYIHSRIFRRFSAFTNRLSSYLERILARTIACGCHNRRPNLDRDLCIGSAFLARSGSFRGSSEICPHTWPDYGWLGGGSGSVIPASKLAWRFTIWPCSARGCLHLLSWSSDRLPGGATHHGNLFKSAPSCNINRLAHRC